MSKQFVSIEKSLHPFEFQDETAYRRVIYPTTANSTKQQQLQHQLQHQQQPISGSTAASLPNRTSDRSKPEFLEKLLHYASSELQSLGLGR